MEWSRVSFRPWLRSEPIKNRDQIIEYLSRGSFVLVSTARMTDPLNKDSARTYSVGFMSDGQLIWPICVRELLQDYPRLDVPPEIVEAVQTKSFPSPLSQEQLSKLVKELLRQQ